MTLFSFDRQRRLDSLDHPRRLSPIAPAMRDRNIPLNVRAALRERDDVIELKVIAPYAKATDVTTHAVASHDVLKNHTAGRRVKQPCAAAISSSASGQMIQLVETPHGILVTLRKFLASLCLDVSVPVCRSLAICAGHCSRQRVLSVFTDSRARRDSMTRDAIVEIPILTSLTRSELPDRLADPASKANFHRVRSRRASTMRRTYSATEIPSRSASDRSQAICGSVNEIINFVMAPVYLRVSTLSMENGA